MTAGVVHPRIAVNEAVELAKAFSTEKSPAFINAILDRVLKRVLGDQGEPEGPGVLDAGQGS
jgi:N utilization substance protein B